MLTTMPSPLDPSIVAVTTTNVSFATKFLMHRVPLGSPRVKASMSNFSASANARNNAKLHNVRRKNWEIAMASTVGME
jgi:hypothetical protein